MGEESAVLAIGTPLCGARLLASSPAATASDEAAAAHGTEEPALRAEAFEHVLEDAASFD